MTILDEAFANINGRVRFNPKPDPIPGDLRLSWRLSALLLVLNRCRGKTASLEQIHFLTSAMRSPAVADVVRRWFSGQKAPDDPIIRYDPAMSRTISLSVAADLTQWKGQSIALTTVGSILIQEIENNDAIMVKERQFLSFLPRSITQKSVRELLEV
jgi:hypothetical protein